MKSVFPKKMAPRRVYTCLAIFRHNSQLGVIPKIPLKYSLSQNGWDTLGSPCPLNIGVQDLVTEPR